MLIATVVAYVPGCSPCAGSRRRSPGVVACLEAVIATVLAWVLLGEHLSAPQIIGGVVVLVGAFIAQSSAPAKPSAGPVGDAVGGGRAGKGVVGPAGPPHRVPIMHLTLVLPPPAA